MTVKELINALENLPKEADVMMDINLCGDEHFACEINYNERNNTVEISDTFTK